MVTIEVDENIMLRSYKPADAAALFTALDDSRPRLHPWLAWVDATTRPAHSQQFIEQSLQRLECQEGLDMGIFYNGQVIGGLGMREWQHDLKRAQIGYWIATDFEGKGIVRRSLIKFIDFLFDKLSLNKLEIHFVPANKRSASLPRLLGFTIEGVIRQSTLRNGMPDDTVIAGMLRSEWTSKRPAD